MLRQLFSGIIKLAGIPFLILSCLNGSVTCLLSFSGYGLNKIAHVASLNYFNYTFKVHPGAWLIHRPHEDTAVSTSILPGCWTPVQQKILILHPFIVLFHLFRFARLLQEKLQMLTKWASGYPKQPFTTR